NLPMARAILSWNTAPPALSPSWVPVWGNVVDAQIQIAGFEEIVLGTFLAESKVEVAAEFKSAVDLAQPIKAAAPKALSAAELHTAYKGKVPAHRFLSASLKKAIDAQATGLATLTGPGSSFAGIKNLNLNEIIGELIGTDGDTTYEELDCVGLNPNLSQLV